VVVDRVEESGSISRALVASRQWDKVLAVARSPQLKYILSNTAEAGYTLDPEDKAEDKLPRSFPAKLLLVLKERFQAGQPGVTLLPCELFERNGEKLLGLVLQLASEWRFPPALADWLTGECIWPNTLVDRIVTVPPEHPLLAEDTLLVAGEPYALWAVDSQKGRVQLFQHPALLLTEDVEPYFLRKVRILNGSHTALVSRALPRGFKTVLDAMNDPQISDWLQHLVFEEIVPTLQGRVANPEDFARQTLERFRNPFLVHRLSDIAVYHQEKVKIRLESTRAEYLAKFGHPPRLLDEAIAGGERKE
jgi:tagaturonate reductase